MNKSQKSPNLVLFLSIAANVVLFASLASGYVSIRKSGAANAAVAQQQPKDGGALSPEAAKGARALLTTDDMTALRDQLRALGLPEATVREIVQARIVSRDAARLREIGNAALETARQRPYWQGNANQFSRLFIYPPDQQKELQNIHRNQRVELRQLFGADPASSEFAALNNPALPPEKALQLQDLQSDYSGLRNQAMNEMAGFKMPGDEAKLKLIADEQKRDELALLTPEEREANDLRSSATARNLQRTLAGFDATEDEYKAIFALQRGLEEKYPTDLLSNVNYFGGANSLEYYRARSEEQKNIDAQIKDMLGDARYAEYVRGQRQDYQALQGAAQRFNLSAETVAQTYQVRDDAANQAKQISDDKSLSVEQKNAAYAALAEQASAQIKTALGDEIGDAYINNALVWLKNLPKGGTVTIGPKGDVYVAAPRAAKK